jgi:hypothetical protein
LELMPKNHRVSNLHNLPSQVHSMRPLFALAR